jgi:hypothetical protein
MRYSSEPCTYLGWRGARSTPVTSTWGNSSAMSTALRVDLNRVRKRKVTRFNLLTKVLHLYPCPEPGAFPHLHRGQETALSPLVRRKFYCRIRNGSSDETAQIAVGVSIYFIIAVDIRYPSFDSRTYPQLILIGRHHIAGVEIVAPPTTDETVVPVMVLRREF